MNFKFSERREKFESIGQSSRFKNFAGHDSQTVSSRCKILEVVTWSIDRFYTILIA